MNTKEIQEQINLLRKGRDYEPCPIEDSELADTMQAMLKENEELRKIRKLCADSLNGMNDKRYRLKEALLDIRVMADKVLKSQATPESTAPVQPAAPDR